MYACCYTTFSLQNPVLGERSQGLPRPGKSQVPKCLGKCSIKSITNMFHKEMETKLWLKYLLFLVYTYISVVRSGSRIHCKGIKKTKLHAVHVLSEPKQKQKYLE